MDAIELSIALPDITLAAKAWGDPSLPPMLALHGWLDNAGTFDRLAPLIEGYYVIALDLPGHGLSEHRPSGVWYHYVDYLDEIRSVAEQLGWSKFTLLGHSLGGVMSSVYAAVFPDHLEKLILIEAIGPLIATPEQTLEHLRQAMTQRTQFTAKKLRIYPSKEDALTARQQANDLSAIAAQCLIERALREVPGGYIWSSDPRLTLSNPLRSTEAQVLNLLTGIQAPTLLILAEPGTPYLPCAIINARAAQVADIQTVRLPGNHHLHLDGASAVAKAINDFAR